MTDDRDDRPGLSAEQVLARMVLSRWDRVRYALLAFGGMMVATLVVSLWATEPGGLPTRTHVAFAGITLAGLVWAGFAGWALSRRGPLFARDRVIGGWLALTFATAATIGMVLIAGARGQASTVLTAVAVGLVLITAAALLLLRVRAQHAALLRLKRELEHRDIP